MFAKTIILLSVGVVVQGRAWPREAAAIEATTANVLATAASIVYDGRVKANATKADFDTTTGPFGPEFVKGQSEFHKIAIVSCFTHVKQTSVSASSSRSLLSSPRLWMRRLVRKLSRCK
jgi:hypothetical protein